MKNRKIHLDYTQCNRLEKTTESYWGLSGRKEADGVWAYEEKDGALVWLSLEEETLTIERKGENHTKIVCCPSQRSEASMETEFGEFRFHVETDYVHAKAEEIAVQYRLIQGTTVVSDMRFCWKIKEEHE